MILIFDTFSGLCNQMYDIFYGINFCIINNINFTFRYCSFREKNLVDWYNEKFEKLFNKFCCVEFFESTIVMMTTEYKNINTESKIVK